MLGNAAGRHHQPRLALAHGTDSTLVDVYSYGGVIWHMMQYSTPFIFLFVVDAFRAMDPALEEIEPHVEAPRAGRPSGASPSR